MTECSQIFGFLEKGGIEQARKKPVVTKIEYDPVINFILTVVKAQDPL